MSKFTIFKMEYDTNVVILLNIVPVCTSCNDNTIFLALQYERKQVNCSHIQVVTISLVYIDKIAHEIH